MDNKGIKYIHRWNECIYENIGDLATNVKETIRVDVIVARLDHDNGNNTNNDKNVKEDILCDPKEIFHNNRCLFL